MKYYNFKMKLGIMNVITIVMFFILYVLTIFINDGLIIDFNPLLFIILIFYFIFHEILHGVGFYIFREVKYKFITFGMCLEKGIFYCMCKDMISKKNILTALLFPFIFIGIITYIVGLAISDDVLILLSIMNICGASCDLLMFFMILGMPKDIKYIDLDDCDGFTILSKRDLKKKYKFFTLVESGIFKDSMRAKNLKKLDISKFSYIVLLLLLVISGIMIIV